ncbi:MAG: hypothetical protein REI09_11285 [Candidatus Dactylopiibacterium sp.]|nr:hypothetical protein [Candidatus Dactylopiibacterium sp.]
MTQLNPRKAEDSARTLADSVSDRASDAIETTRRAAENQFDAARNGIENLRDAIPEKVGQAVDGLEHYASVGLKQARAACASVKTRVDDASEATRAYVREEPVKSLLIAVASGALIAGAASWLARRRPH